MTTADAISELLEDFYQIQNAPGVPTADDTALRNMVLRILQRGVNWFWMFRNWSWRQQLNAVTLLQEGEEPTVGLPVDFHQAGRNMALFRELDGVEVTRRLPQTISRLRQTSVNARGPALHYALGFFRDDDGGLARLMDVFPTNTVDANLIINKYLMLPPTLVDSTEDANGLTQVPEDYHETIIIPYGQKALMRLDGDARETAVDAEIREAVSLAWRDEARQNDSVRTGRYGRSGHLYR